MQEAIHEQRAWFPERHGSYQSWKAVLCFPVYSQTRNIKKESTRS